MPGQSCSPSNKEKGGEMVIMDRLGSVRGWYLKAFATLFYHELQVSRVHFQ